MSSSSSSASEQATTKLNELTLNSPPSPAAAAAEEAKILTLVSADLVEFQVDEKAASVSQLLKRIIEDECAGNAIPLPNVQAEILEFVVRYCKRHADGSEVKDQDKEEIKALEMEKLFEVVRAANYLEVKELLDLACQTAAEAIKDMMPEEVRKIFGVVNDYTEEEEQALREEYNWAFQV